MPPRPLSTSTVASSRSAMHSHSTLPAGVRARSTRCPMANAGVVSMVVSPAARRRNLLLCAPRSRSSVVQDCPEAGTNCRSSVQTGHLSGGASAGGYCVPQAVQMKAGMAAGYTSPAAAVSGLAALERRQPPASVLPNVSADFSELDGIAFARHGSANDPAGDHLNHGVAAVLQPELVEGG